MKKISLPILLGFILILSYSCNELLNNEQGLTLKQKDSIEKFKKDSARTEVLASYKKNKLWSIDKPWIVEDFKVFGNDKEGYDTTYLNSSVKDSEVRLKRSIKWSVYRALQGDFKAYTHYQGILCRNFFGTSAVPNINDTVIDYLRIEHNFNIIKTTELDSIDYLVSDNILKEGRIKDKLFQRFMPFALFSSYIREYYLSSKANHEINSDKIDFFPVIYRNKRTCGLVWDIVKPLLFEGMTRKQFNQLNGNFYLDNLLYSYNTLKAKNGFKVFELALTNNTKVDYKQFMDDAFKSKFKNEGDMLENPESIRYPLELWRNWYFSFWYRRHIEGTTELTYKILNEIKEYYNQ